MEEIRNCKGGLLCVVNPVTGYLEARITHTTILRMELPIGARLNITSRGVSSEIERVSDQQFYVNSYQENK